MTQPYTVGAKAILVFPTTHKQHGQRVVYGIITESTRDCIQVGTFARSISTPIPNNPGKFDVVPNFNDLYDSDPILFKWNEDQRWFCNQCDNGKAFLLPLLSKLPHHTSDNE